LHCSKDTWGNFSIWHFWVIKTLKFFYIFHQSCTFLQMKLLYVISNFFWNVFWYRVWY
jgi:hypothetical protein